MKKWFIWWIERLGGGQWYGPRYLTDHEAFNEQLAIETGTPGVQQLYRWMWDGSTPTWQYDTRSNGELLASDVRFAWF